MSYILQLYKKKYSSFFPWFIILYFFSYFPYIDSLDEIITLISPNNCSRKHYFDYESFSCVPCGNGFQKSLDGLSCECSTSQQLISSIGGQIQQFCVPCKPTDYVTADQSVCIPRSCFKNASGKTSCNVCKKNQIMVTHAANGSVLPTIQCTNCAPGSFPSRDKTFCQPCYLRMAKHNGSACNCDPKSFTLLEDVCVTNDFIKTAVSKMKSEETYDSQYFEKNWILENYLCSLRNKSACQIVANMCVLSLYKTGENSPCVKWRSQKAFATPVIMYGEDEAYSVLLRKKISLTYSISANSEVNHLDVTALSINLKGEINPVRDKVSKWLLLCPAIWKLSEPHMFKFAENFRYKCKIGAEQLLTTAKTVFFEPYLRYTDKEKSVDQFYAIPVLLRGNLVDFNKENEINTWQLVRRFFIFDMTSGLEITANGSKNLKYFRYAKKIHINVRIRRKGRDERNKIYPPLFIIEYGELSSEDIRNNLDMEHEFAIQYELDGGSMIHGIEISIGTLSAFATVYSILQSWSHSRRSGRSGFDLFTILQFFIIVSGNLANTFFIVAFGASTFSFILFKTQKSVYAVPPPERDEYAIESYIIVAFSLKIVEVLAVNWRQISVDLFFIDWEKPNMPVNEIGIKGHYAASEFRMSFWRPYFVANEWNEIQTLRKVSLPTHLVACIFATEIFGASSWTNIGVVIAPDQSSEFLTSPAYQLALGGLIFLILYFIQLILSIFIYERYIKNFIQDFMDICSISNVSMLILDAQLHGYYLHGRCVHASCDTDARGLLPGLPYTAFIVRCTSEFRLYYNRLGLHMISRDMKWQWQHHLAHPRDQPMLNSSTLTGFQTGRRPGSKSSRGDEGDRAASEQFSPLPPALERREQASRFINKFLTAFFDHALEDLDYEVREKRWIERLLDVELTNESTNKTLLLYNTTGDPQSFQRTIWYGQEWTLATFDLYLFCFVQMMSGSYILAALINVIVWKVLCICRNYGGKRNLARKTLIDERFLV